ncbi:MAG: MFS transporter [Deltaproteobacteria bacterium]|nr:MFS transporter [Deltaproteobacteria bacterium]
MVAAQVALNFSFTFVTVFLPFYIREASHLDAQGTLLWTGLIMGAAPFAASITSPFWAHFTTKASPKGVFEKGIISNFIAVLLMGLITNIRVLFALRLLQGLLGGLSTIGLIITTVASSKERLTRNIGIYQSGMTLGQLSGPPIGAAVASAFGFRAAFLVAAGFMLLILAFSRWGLGRIPPQQPAPRGTRSSTPMFPSWLLCFTSMIQISFFASVLPDLLAWLRVAPERAVAAAGLVVTSYGVSAAVGSYLIDRVAPSVPRRTVVLAAALSAAALQLLLAATSSLLAFTVVRMVQAGLVAGIMPLVISQVARQAGGVAIGTLNTARFAAHATGPLLATSVLSVASPFTLFALISGLSLGSLLTYLRSTAGFPSSGAGLTSGDEDPPRSGHEPDSL